MLSHLLSPVSIDEFTRRYRASTYCHIPGHPKKFSSLFGWPDLNALLQALPHAPPGLRVISAGQPIAPRDRAELLRLCREGGTLLVRDLQDIHPPIGALATQLSADVGDEVWANLYVSQPGKPGFNRHYDTHDVFVLQLEGEKKWTLCEPTVDFPLSDQPSDRERPPEQPGVEIVLRRGDVLYLPRGYWHEALAQEGESMHITLGVAARTGVGFARWLGERLKASADFRAPFPLERIPPVMGDSWPTDSPSVDHVRSLMARLRELLADETRLAGEYLEHCAQLRVCQQAASFPMTERAHGVRGDTLVWPVPGLCCRILRCSDHCELTGNGRTASFGLELYDLAWSALSGSDPFTADALASRQGQPAPAVLDFVRERVCEGFLALERPWRPARDS